MDTPAFRADQAVKAIARQMVPPTQKPGERSASRADMGLLAPLRRFHPVEHGRHSVFETEQVLHAAGVVPHDENERLRWAVVVHCLALAHGAHGHRSPGEALASIRFGEPRLRQLLQADADTLMNLLPLLARRLAAESMALDWWPFAKLLLNAGIDEARANEARSRIARDYIEAPGGKSGAAATPASADTGAIAD